VREAVRVEVERAAIRGISLREEQLDLVDERVHRDLLNRHKIAQGFAEKMRERLS
jgi:hypothetical protein